MVIFFAQGYRFDFNFLKIVKTGGVFIKTSVDGAKIYINDKYIESTGGILNYSTLISGLAPKKYNIFVYKENYYPWNKIIEIKNGMVVELGNIILFPLELKKNKIVELPSQVISDFNIKDDAIEIKNNKTKIAKIYDLSDGKLLSSGKFKIATSTTSELISPDENKKLYVSNNQLWIAYLNDIKKEPVKKAGEKELIAAYESPVQFFNWLSDSEHFIWFVNNELSIAELDNRGGKRNSVKFYININSPIFWDNENNDFYFFEKKILYKISFKS